MFRGLLIVLLFLAAQVSLMAQSGTYPISPFYTMSTTGMPSTDSKAAIKSITVNGSPFLPYDDSIPIRVGADKDMITIVVPSVTVVFNDGPGTFYRTYMQRPGINDGPERALFGWVSQVGTALTNRPDPFLPGSTKTGVPFLPKYQGEGWHTQEYDAYSVNSTENEVTYILPEQTLVLRMGEGWGTLPVHDHSWNEDGDYAVHLEIAAWFDDEDDNDPYHEGSNDQPPIMGNELIPLQLYNATPPGMDYPTAPNYKAWSHIWANCYLEDWGIDPMGF